MVKARSIVLAASCVTLVALSGLCDRTNQQAGQVFRVPYRISETMHMVVRVRFNGHGPFHFIIDTGAPTMFVRSEAAKKAGFAEGADGWAVIDEMEIEGGVQLEHVRAIVEDIFQLRGMNGMGLAGTPLDGVIGYTVLARFRMEYDLSRSAMVWTKLDFEPPLPVRLGGGTAPPELEALGGVVGGLGAMLGRNVEETPLPRGMLGIELADQEDGVEITHVLAKSPAETAGLQAGDVLVRLADKPVSNAAEAVRLASGIAVGRPVKLSIQRGKQTIEVTAKTTTGL